MSKLVFKRRGYYLFVMDYTWRVPYKSRYTSDSTGNCANGVLHVSAFFALRRAYEPPTLVKPNLSTFRPRSTFSRICKYAAKSRCFFSHSLAPSVPAHSLSHSSSLFFSLPLSLHLSISLTLFKVEIWFRRCDLRYNREGLLFRGVGLSLSFYLSLSFTPPASLALTYGLTDLGLRHAEGRSRRRLASLAG